MAEFQKVAATNEIPLGSIKSFTVGFDQIVICHNNEGFFALEDCCSHDSAPISDGHIDSEGKIVCARHGAKFDCQSGEVKAPPAVVGINTFKIKVENNEIYVNLG